MCRIGIGRHVAEHLDTGQHPTSSLDVVGLHRGCGAELEWRVMHPPWPGARPFAPTRCPRAASASVAMSRSTSTLDSIQPQASGWCGLHRGCGAELEWRVMHPPWPGARPPVPTQCPRAASASVAMSRSTSTLDSIQPPASGWCGLHRGCGAEVELRVMHPPWPGARPPAPTRCLRAASASVALSRSTSTLDSIQPPASGWLACAGAVALSSSWG